MKQVARWQASCDQLTLHLWDALPTHLIVLRPIYPTAPRQAQEPARFLCHYEILNFTT